MAGPLSVGSSYRSGWFVAPLTLGAVSILIAPVCRLGPAAVTVFLVVGGLALAAGALAGRSIRARRRWLEVTPEGFVVTGPGFSRACADGDVDRLGFSLTRNFQSGLPKSLTCRMTVILGGGERFEMVHTQGLSEKSEFVTLAERLFGNLHRRSKEALGKGGELRGEGWTLTRGSLAIEGGAEIPLGEIAAVGDFDDRVLVWRKGENEAVLTLAGGSPNAGLLQKLLTELLPPPDDSPRTLSGDDLGKVLFERRSAGVGLWALAALAFLVSWIFFAGRNPAAGAAAVGVAALLGLGAWWMLGTVFRCHENGVMRRTRRGALEIRYRDVSAFTYKAVRHFTNGIYTGTTLNLEFVSLPQLGSERIAWGASSNGLDEELDHLRDHISKVIAMRMAEELEGGKPVRWTSHLRLLPDGIEFRPAGLIGRKDPEVVRFAEVENFSLEQGYFQLWVRGRGKSVLREPVSEPNFFPGFLLLSSIFRQEGSSDGEEGEGGEGASAG